VSGRYLFVVGNGIGNQVQTVPAFLYLHKHSGHPVDVVNIDGINTDITNWLYRPLADRVLLKDDVMPDQYEGQFLTLLCQCNPFPDMKVFSTDVASLSDRVSEVKLNLMAVDGEWEGFPEGLLDWIPATDAPDVLIHDGYAKNTAFVPWSVKSWPGHVEAAQRLISEGLSVGSIGSRDELVGGTEDFTGLSLRGTMSLIKGAKVLLSNDSGMYHLACAMKVPCVVVFTCTNPLKNYDTDFHYTACVQRLELPCSPCQGKVFEPNDAWLRNRSLCLWQCRDVPVDGVVEAVVKGMDG